MLWTIFVRNRFVGYFVLLILIAAFSACASTSK